MMRKMKQQDGTYKMITKYVGQVPQVNIANHSARMIRALCQEFGMTPSARVGMEVPRVAEEDDTWGGILPPK